jgi:hypothetical protein
MRRVPPERPVTKEREREVRYLRELPTTWKKADGGPGRRMLAEALFSRIEVLGAREATIHLTGEAVAYGFAAAIPDRIDVTVGTGRGERTRPDPIPIWGWVTPPPGSRLVREDSA